MSEMRLPKDRMDALVEERDRQTQMFSEAIEQAIISTQKQIGGVAMVEALAGALVCHQAHALCRAPSGLGRKALRKAMDDLFRRAMREFDEKTNKAQVIDMTQVPQ